MPNLCKSFQSLASDTWSIIETGRRVNLQLKEETITDLLVLDLKYRHPGKVLTKVFTKWEEGRNGADWEWWFGKPGRWIGFRVQAKIINIKRDEFEHLHYKSPKPPVVYQCDKLIKNALKPPWVRIPLYCLFVQTDDTTLLNTWHCGSIPNDKRLTGCLLTSAFTVRKLRPLNKKHLRDLQDLSRPWHCLVCCTAFSGNDPITRMHEYAKNNFDLFSEGVEGLPVEIPVNFILENPPEYVSALLSNEDNQEIQPPDEDIDGILIYDYRDEQGE